VFAKQKKNKRRRLYYSGDLTLHYRWRIDWMIINVQEKILQGEGEPAEGEVEGEGERGREPDAAGRGREPHAAAANASDGCCR
jgi:hypothetical protein